MIYSRELRDADCSPSQGREIYVYIKREIYHDLMSRGRYKLEAGDVPRARGRRDADRPPS